MCFLTKGNAFEAGSSENAGDEFERTEGVNLLPDLTSIRKELDELLVEFLQRRSRARSGVMHQIKNVVMYECQGYEQHRSDGSVDNQGLAPIEGTIRLDPREIEQKGFTAVLEAYDQAAAKLGDAMKEYFFHRMDEIVTEAGQSWDAGGRQLSPELIFECYEKLDIDFDSKGMPCLPTLVVPPSMADRISKWNMTDEQQSRFEQIIEQKRLAWRNRESDRRLVD